jgi:hypothetical protein
VTVRSHGKKLLRKKNPDSWGLPLRSNSLDTTTWGTGASSFTTQLRIDSRRQSAHAKLNVCFVPIADKVKDRIATITLKGRQLPAAKVLAN